MEHEEDAAVVIGIMNLYNSKVDAGSEGIIYYYQDLQAKNKEKDRMQRKDRIDASDSTMSVRYKNITNLQYSDVLYNSFMTEKYRTVITRWRLSCHSLRIETGRYQRPILPRNERTCSICYILEDEQHSLFVCQAHTFIRLRYANILNNYTTTQSILHPSSMEDACAIGRYILDIERNMEALKMIIKT